MVLTIALLPVGSPSEPSTAAGWAITATLIALGGLLVVQTHRRKVGGWGRLLAINYVIVAALTLMQWVGGGLGEPYNPLLLLPVGFVAATQPPRRILVFLLFVLVAMTTPLIYDGWDSDEAGSILASFVIWCGLSGGVSLLMAGVRAQRLAHAAEEEAARAEARIDSLTGLHNRRAFDEMLIAEVARARRLNLPLSVAMVDIESFKEINDRWSYAEGDRCLCNVAVTLRDNVRSPPAYGSSWRARTPRRALMRLTAWLPP